MNISALCIFQVVPVPSSRASGIKDIFNLAAKKLGFKFKTIESKELEVNNPQ